MYLRTLMKSLLLWKMWSNVIDVNTKKKAKISIYCTYKTNNKILEECLYVFKKLRKNTIVTHFFFSTHPKNQAWTNAFKENWNSKSFVNNIVKIELYYLEIQIV